MATKVAQRSTFSRRSTANWFGVTGMYDLRILEDASHELARLDKGVGRRIVERVNWLASNLGDIRPEALSGDLVGLYKLRVGDYPE